MAFTQLRWIHAYVVLLAAGAALIMTRVDWATPPNTGAFLNVMAALAALAFLAEAVSLQMWRGTRSAVSFVPYLAAIVMVGPAWGAALGGLVKLCSGSLIWRKPLVKVVHNSAVQVIAIAASGYLYIVLGGSFAIDRFAPNQPSLVLGFAVAVGLYFVIANGSPAIAIRLSSGGDLLETWRELVWKEFSYNVLSASLALLLAFLYIELQVLGFLLVILPLFFLRQAHSVTYKLERANRDLLELMVKSIEARDPYTSGHSLRVARIAKLVAKGLNLSVKEVEQIETAALMHDVGKIYDEYAPILRKEGRLTPEEQQLMHTHPIRSAELIATISDLRGYVEQCVRHHHENWDGGGYPDGLMGEEIPLGARIIMIADTADAMMTDRPYRKALSYERVVAEFDKFSRKQFDPALVLAFKKSTAIRRMIDDRPGIDVVTPEPRPRARVRLEVP